MKRFQSGNFQVVNIEPLNVLNFTIQHSDKARNVVNRNLEMVDPKVLHFNLLAKVIHFFQRLQCFKSDHRSIKSSALIKLFQPLNLGFSYPPLHYEPILFEKFNLPLQFTFVFFSLHIKSKYFNLI